MPSRTLRELVERGREGELEGSDSLGTVTGISDRVAAQYASDNVAPGSKLAERYPSLAADLRDVRDAEAPRFERTRRAAGHVAAFVAASEDYVSIRVRHEGLFRVETVGEFVASTASTRPVATRYSLSAAEQVRAATLDPCALGVPSDRWRQLALLGKSPHVDAYRRDLSAELPPAELSSLGSSYRDPARSSPPVDESVFVVARDVSKPVTVDGTTYVVLTAREDVRTLFDEDERESAVYHPVQVRPLVTHGVVTGTNYGDPDVLRETVRVAADRVENPDTSDPEHVGALLDPAGDGYATHARSNRQWTPVYGIRESLLFDRLADEYPGKE